MSGPVGKPDLRKGVRVRTRDGYEAVLLDGHVRRNVRAVDLHGPHGRGYAETDVSEFKDALVDGDWRPIELLPPKP